VADWIEGVYWGVCEAGRACVEWPQEVVRGVGRGEGSRE
jgi:hypothetical protein